MDLLLDMWPQDTSMEMTKTELETWLTDLYDKAREYNEKKERVIQENFDHLVKRSEELNEPVPTELAIRSMMYPMFVDIAFIKKYEKWMKE